jgi:hypothetical protein
MPEPQELVPGDPARYQVVFGTGVIAELDAEGQLDAAKIAGPKRDNMLWREWKERPPERKDEPQPHDAVLRSLLLGPKTGESIKWVGLEEEKEEDEHAA